MKLPAIALLLAAAPSRSGARNLRRGSSSSDAAMTVNIVRDEEEGLVVYSSNDFEGDGFDAVGEPFFMDPPITADDNGGKQMWHYDSHGDRQLLQEEATETEEEAEPKEYVNDETLAFVDPDERERERQDRSCDPETEKLWSLRFRTDQYGYETSWALERQLAGGGWETLAEGPPGNTKYYDNTVYRGNACLPGGHMYRLTVMDAHSDGLCCGYGRGYYSYGVDGVTEYDTTGRDTFDDVGAHSFYVGLPTPDDGFAGGGGGPFQGRGPASCGADKQEIRIKIWTDKYGAENSWELVSLETDQAVQSKGLKSYGANDRDDVAVCVPNGRYRFRMTDGVGDGICCGAQGDGRYEIYVDGTLIIYGSDFTFGKLVEHDIVIGYHNRLTSIGTREKQYLDCHNWRRKKYHEMWGATYVPLIYDLSLEADAQSWADELLNDCDEHGIKHEPGAEQGENLAKNTGNGKWGQLYPVENICRRWFEREETWGWPENAHLTQGAWRSARYVGCAESDAPMDNGGTCRIQVCRYARAGNCNMAKHKSGEGDNWKVPMLMDHNPCGPVCPPNGCHAPPR